jgi:tetratricopeptide (TPR) repeat protein
MSDCTRVEGAIVDYLEECLPGEERAPLEAHLAGCARCRDTVRSYRLIRESYRAAPELEVASELAARILAAARAERGAPRRIGRRVLLAAALAVAVLVPLALYLARDEEPARADRIAELVQRGDELRGRDPDGARSAYQEALALADQGPRAPSILQRLAELCVERNEHELALSYLTGLCERYPTCPERQAALLLRAETLAALHRDEEALQAYAQVAAEFPQAASEVGRRVQALQSDAFESLRGLGYAGE